ncbi:peptidoglycan-binding protein [Micromonospora phytophila]|uniref:peptidoglycan-binding protein n=1 Tax=Micromonospora phytophila TaxID=709888 RepID=UPI00202F9C29|nr:peptidoglycan-binding protein [Micromonospora phytophila]MCM0676614.1 peptidoglycan-binding protein [Micromonospora phytophila]
MSVPDSDDPAARSPLARRRRALTAFGVATLVTSTIGLLAATQVKSPQQVAADTRPPTPSVLTAPVVRQVLSTTLVMRGTFSTGRQHPFTPRSVAASAHGPGGAVLVVTALGTRAGRPVQAGRMLVEVSERPVYALPGAFPAYRDMLPGQIGKDIAQLQAGLRDLGYRSGDERGHFGPGTAAAVRRFYRDLGYPVPLTAPVADDTRQADPLPSATGRPAPPAARTPEPMVPMSEVAFLPTLPSRVAALSARVGDIVAGETPLITFATGGLTLTAKLDPSDEALVKVGAAAEIVAETTGYTGRGTVESLGAKTTGGESPHIPLRITGASAWPADLAGEDVRVTLTTASTGDEVLAVPEAAISSAADGRTSVTVLTDDRQRLVRVTVGASADGLVEVTPVDGELRPGDQVVTGAADPAAGQPGDR